MTEGNYYYNITNKRCFIKLVGHVHYSNSAGFEQFVADIINKGIIDNILIDLSETTGIDSTNLGLVAKLANYTISSHKKKITLITANPDVTTILDSMGFFEVSVIVETEDASLTYNSSISLVPLTISYVSTLGVVRTAKPLVI